MKTKIRRRLLLLPLLLLGVSFSAALLPNKAYAVTTNPGTGGSTNATVDTLDTGINQHIDRSTILYSGQYYFDSKIDDNYSYADQGDNDGCQDFIDSLKNGNAQATLHTRTKNPVNGACDDKKSTITLQHTERSYMPFDYIDKNTIATSDQQTTYTLNTQLSEFLENGGDKCKDTIKVTAGPSDAGATLSVLASTGGQNTAYDNWSDQVAFDTSNSGDGGNGCTTYGPNTYKASTVYLNNPSVLQASPAAGTSSSSGGTGDNTSSNGSPDVNCGGLSLNWIICPIEEGLTTAIRGVDAIINNLLEINTDSIFSSCPAGQVSANCKTSNAYKAAWSSMRSIALALLVIGVLIMIISQAAGFDFVDAYTIRKVLPRVIIAAIGITLSWVLLKFFVSFANDVGNSIRSLIYAPFSGLSHSIVLGWSGALGGTILVLLGTILLGLGLLSFLATALLAVLAAVLVLIIRQVLIVFLIIIAPIAVVSYILPNTKKMYDIWWDFFAKGLMMFPFIAAFIATGRVFAQVATEQAQSAASGTVTSQIYGILAFVAYFAPYFLLPLTLRFAGGALGTIGGFVNDRSKGSFDRLRQYRSKRAKDRYQRASSQSLWRKDTKLGKAGNALATWTVSPHSNAAYYARNKRIPIVSRAGREIAGQIDAARMEQSQKWFERVNKNGANDKYFSGVGGMYDDFSDETKRQLVKNKFGQWAEPVDEEGYKVDRNGNHILDSQGNKTIGRVKADHAITSEADAIAMADILGRKDNESDSEQKAAFALRANAAYTANMYKDAEMTKADVATGAALGRAVHGFLAPQDSADSENLLTKMYGAEYAHAATVNAQQVASNSNPDNKPGYGTQYDRATGEWITAHEGSRGWAVLPTLNPGNYAQAKGNMLKDSRLGGEISDAITINNGGPGAQAIIDRWQAQGISEKEIESRVNIANSQHDAIKDTLYNLAGPYSQSSGDTKARALELIEKGGWEQDFALYRRATTDPTLRGQAGLPEQPPQQPGQPGAGGPPLGGPPLG